MSFSAEVEWLFRTAPDRFWKIRENPVTGGHWVSGEDPIEAQKKIAIKALKARAPRHPTMHLIFLSTVRNASP
jgi:hypothetical protein